jgi:branched-chain amino acid transport system permease protein
MIPTLFLEVILNGLVLGLIYALMSIGLTLIFSIMRLSNFTHGEFYMIGGYAIYLTSSFLGIHSFLALPSSLVAGFLVGIAIEKTFIEDAFKKAIERPFEYAMLATLALSILLQNLAKEIVGPFHHSAPLFVSGSIQILAFTLSLNRLVILVITVVSLAGLYYFIANTRTGRAWRAVSQNIRGAIISGIDDAKARLLAYGFGAALAALSGGLLSTVYGIWPSVGFTPLVLSFVIITLGGLGSLKGAFIGALIVGLAHSLISSYFSPSYADVAMYLILLFVLVFRPTGLFGEKA